ncbi:MAG: flagellar basal body M-ring protein FliF [Aquabacterium sp.]|jgi:flagellar M-ring protein FliF|nr:MAG: flagellar basal body M-ring protein FliF [Aquabacterium sp.]
MEVSAVRPQSPVATSTAPTLIQEAPTGFLARLNDLPLQRKLMLGGGIAAVLAIIVATILWSQQADYKVLYANLSDKDGGAVLAQLSQMNIPYKHADGGNAILVPADKVHDVRLKLASAGLPKGGVVGYELMETQRFGVTQFQERLNFQRGLEGELTRSIESLAAVSSARVHLALPNQNGFFREQQKPSASVVLTLHSGRTLDRTQIAGIVHLVSSSVPEMSPKAVSVLDQTGSLLSGPDGSDQDGLDAQQLQYVHQVENSLTKRVVDLLEPVVGRDNLRAQVTAEVDFSQVESTAEEFKPNQAQKADAAIRSMQTTETTGSSAATPTGIPGAATNQPPVPATAPINGASQPLQTAGGANNGSSNSHREAVTNYELDKTVRVTRNATGGIKRLNAAVVINNVTKTDAKGKTSTVPLSQEELDKLTTLVREAVGYSEGRGDSVKVINAPFKVEKIEAEDIPFWKNADLRDGLRSLAVPATLLVLALIVVFGAIRPALKAAEKARPERLEAVVDDAEALPDGEGLPALAAPANNVVAQRLEAARQLAKENPVAVANIVRGWVSKEA